LTSRNVSNNATQLPCSSSHSCGHNESENTTKQPNSDIFVAYAAVSSSCAPDDVPDFVRDSSKNVMHNRIREGEYDTFELLATKHVLLDESIRRLFLVTSLTNNERYEQVLSADDKNTLIRNTTLPSSC
jgi:hypothetical protein